MKIKKVLLSIISIIISINLISCGSLKNKMINSRLNELNEDTKVSDKHLDDILGALKNKDKESLKKMFSISTLKVAKDIDKNIDYVMDFFDGEVISVDGGPGQSAESNNGGVSVAEDTYKYTITTDKGNYLLFLLYISSDSFNKENEGLYMLQLINKEDSEIECDYGQVIRCPGVYVPPVSTYTDIKFQNGTEIPGGFKFLKYQEDHSNGNFTINATIQSEIAYGDIEIAFGFFDANGKKIGIASGRTKDPVEAGETFEVNMHPRGYGNDLNYEDIASCQFFGIDAR